MESKKLTAESAPVFQEGISLILTRWSALTAAVENEWGGRDSLGKANAICTDVFSFFTEARAEPLYIDDLENLLEEGLLSLNTLVEDGSVEEVAEKLMIMHEECLEDIAANMMVDVPNSQSSLNPVSMLTDEPKQNQSAEAEDSWVVVSSRKNKGRRN
ncbi:hypothetical protein GOBAR_DD33909 [Gossypium barbadense]|nr:hypothetical protein GOBAR_DD33909 [Gossypium barbadense]